MNKSHTGRYTHIHIYNESVHLYSMHMSEWHIHAYTYIRTILILHLNTNPYFKSRAWSERKIGGEEDNEKNMK